MKGQWDEFEIFYVQKATRAKKDPNAPKRGQSAYMIWLNSNRASLTKPGMGVTDVAKAAGLAWGVIKDKTVGRFWQFQLIIMFVSLFYVVWSVQSLTSEFWLWFCLFCFRSGRRWPLKTRRGTNGRWLYTRPNRGQIFSYFTLIVVSVTWVVIAVCINTFVNGWVVLCKPCNMPNGVSCTFSGCRFRVQLSP